MRLRQFGETRFTSQNLAMTTFDRYLMGRFFGAFVILFMLLILAQRLGFFPFR